VFGLVGVKSIQHIPHGSVFVFRGMARIIRDDKVSKGRFSVYSEPKNIMESG